MKKVLYLTLFIVLVAGMVGCGGGGSGESHHAGSKLVVTNSSYVICNVYFNGAYMFTLYQGQAGTITDISSGNHTVSALRQPGDHYVNGTSFYADGYTTYTWTITEPY